MVLRNGISVATQALGICMLLWSATTRSFSHDEMEWWSEFRGMEGWAIAAVTRLLHKSRHVVVTQAPAFSVARAWRSSPSSLSLLFIDRIALPAGRMMRPAR